MKFKKKLLASLILSGQIYPASAALIRDDIDVQVYRDFGENRGVFKPGAVNIPIYKSDGSLSGTVNVMPDFSSSIDGGYATLVNPQVTATATHLPYNSEASFGKRYQQLDATLFSGAEKASSYTLMNEVSKRAYEVADPGGVSNGGDYMLTRERTIVTDAAPAELFTDTKQFKPGLLVARTGSGSFYIATGPGKDKYICYPSGWSWSGMCQAAGGMNVITAVHLYQTVPGGAYSLAIVLKEDPKTAIDVGTLSGDSGSGLWGWDTVSGSWKFIGVDSSGVGSGYNKQSNFASAPEWTKNVINSFNDPAINTLHSSDIIYIGAQDKSTGQGNFTLNGNTIRYHGIRTDIAASARTNNDFMSNKNLILGGAGGTLQLTAPNLDMGAGSITFNSNYILSDGGDSSRRMNTAGYIINQDATVLSNITGSAGDIWRKIGLGTLVIGGSGVNHSGLYVGDGLTILQREGGHAADAIHISSGRAIVRLGSAGQLDGTQVGFGTRGGILDLYGQSLSWNDIIHMDSGATIAATKANTTSTFTFTGSGPKTYLGNFFDGGELDKGLLHLVYAPQKTGSSWTLKGNINTRGGMDILKGNVGVQGAFMLHAGGNIDPTQYETASFDLGDSLVNLTGSQFTVGRNAVARGHFVLDNNSSLVMASGGEVSSSEQGVAEGAYLDGSVELSGANSVLKATPEEAFRVQVNAALSGAGHILKEGLGTLYLTGANTLTGNSLISSGRVIADTLASLGTKSAGWTIAESGVLDVGKNTDNLATVLDKISDSSRGVLAMTGAITSADKMSLLPKELYLGSGSNLVLGVAGQNLTHGAQDLYLGGGGGEVKIDGYLPSDGSSLFLGNGQSTGTVRIASINDNWTGNIDLRRGINLIADYDNSLGNESVNVNYGATAESNILRHIKTDSAGMVSVNTADNFSFDMSKYTQLAIGALAGETLTLTDTLKPTQTGYYFSGAGNVNINSMLLKGNNLTIDAQDNRGGTVTLNTANDLNGQVTVRGYNSESLYSDKSNMTLKLGVDNAFDKNSSVVLEDGGVLDLNGHSLTMNVGKGSKNSKIISSKSTSASILTLSGEKDAVLNSKISGAAMHLVKSGVGTLTLGGTSDFTGDVLLSAGKTIAGGLSAFGAAANSVTVAKNALLDLNGNSIANSITLASGTLLNSKAGTLKLNTITLSDDSTATFNGTTDSTDIGKYVLNGHRLTVNNIYTTFGTNSVTDGDLVFNNSQVYWNGSNNSLLNGSGSLTVGSNTLLELRDVKQVDGPSKTIVLKGGTIGSGSKTHNGGGSGATLRSDLRVDGSGTLTGNNWGFHLDMKLYGALSGAGTLNIAGAQGVDLYGDTSAFTGGLVLKNSSLLYLSPLADTTLAANLSTEGSGKAFKTGAKNLTLTGDNHRYTNELAVQGGTLTLGSTTAATGGDIRMTAGTLKLDADNKVSLSNLAAGSTVDLHGHSGTLTIKANAAGSTITSSDAVNDSALNLQVGSNSTLNSTITGKKIHLNKQGAGTLTLSGSNSFTGDVLLSAGKTIAGGLSAFGAAANSVTVAKNALLELNGNSIANSINLASGTLLNSKAGALKLNTITLSDDSTATFNSTAYNTDIGKYVLNGHRLTVNNIYTTFGTNSVTDGDLVFNNSQVYWSGSNNSLLKGSGSLTVGDNTLLELRDVKQVDGPSKTIVLKGGTIGSGSKTHNGGGIGATLRSDLRVDGSGTLIGNNWGFHLDMKLYGALSGAGTLNIAGAQGVDLYGNTSGFTGDLVLKNSSWLYLSPLADTTLAANLSTEGSGKAFKTGAKNLTLTGDNHRYTNELAVQGGTLTLGSTTAATGGNISVQSGATLSSEYSNRFGGSLNNSGTVNLKRGGTILKVAGNYTQQANAILAIGLDPLLGAANLNIAGSASLAGTLKAIYAPGTYKAQTYTVLSAQKGVKGRFANVTQEGGAGMGQQIGYTANNVTLTTSKSAGVKSLRRAYSEMPDASSELAVADNGVKPATQMDTPASEEILAKDEQQTSVAQTSASQTDTGHEELAALMATATAQADSTTTDVAADAETAAHTDDPTIDVTAQADDTASPYQDEPTFVVTPENLRAYDMQRLALGMQKPTRLSMEQVDWSTASASQAVCDTSETCYHDDAMWIMPHMSNGRISSGNGNAKVDGIAIGGYTEVANTRFGASVDYSDYDLSDSRSSASENRYAINLFASQKMDGMVMTGSLGYTHAPTDVTRKVTSEGFNLGEGKSHLSGNALSSGLSLNWPVQMGNTQIVPQVGIDSLNVFYSGFDEHMSAKGEAMGSFINTMKVRGDSDRYDSVQPNVGVKVSHDLMVGNAQVTPMLKVTYRHELMNNNNGAVASNDGTLFTVQSDNLGRDIVEYEAGVDVKMTPRLSTSFSYTGSNQQGYQSQEGMIRVKYNF